MPLWPEIEPRPLRRLLTVEKLRVVPRQPGVYWLVGFDSRGGGGRVLYVGKSLNLRQRLAGYRNLRPSRAPHALRRMLGRVEEVRWQVCEDHYAASLLEAELLLRYRPRGNRVGTHPESRWYAGLFIRNRKLVLWRRRVPLAEGEWFGPFPKVTGFAAVVRCLWRALYDRRDATLPPGWCDASGPCLAEFRLSETGPDMPSADCLAGWVRAYWAGESDALVSWLTHACRVSIQESWNRRFWERDLAEVAAHYRRVTRRWRGLRRRFGLTESCLCDGDAERLLALSRATAEQRRAS